MNSHRTASALVLSLATLLLAATSVAAQKNPAPSADNAPTRLFHGGVGLLLGSAGFGAAVDLSMHSGGRVYRGRLAGHDNSIASWQSGVEPLSISETALMLGRGRRFTRNYGSVVAGLALVTIYRGGDDVEGTTTVGIPVEAQLISGGPLRLGATLAGNLNLEQPFAAFILSLQLGRVPDR